MDKKGILILIWTQIHNWMTLITSNTFSIFLAIFERNVPQISTRNNVKSFFLIFI